MPKVKVEGLDRVVEFFNAESRRKSVSGYVGYSADHAIYVHEDLEASHPNGGQAKFLEQPARTMRNEMNAIIAQEFRNHKSLASGLDKALNALLDASQFLVPVDTGELKESGRVVIEDGD